MQQKPTLVITASPRAREGADSILLRLMRDYEQVFKRYQLHTTDNTGQVILTSGRYLDNVDIFRKRAGDLGGTVELAALVARNLCNTVFLLLDPSDPWTDAVENWALRRVSIKRGVYLITNYSAAVHWAIYHSSDRPDGQGQDVRAGPGEQSHPIRKDPLAEVEPGLPNTTERGNFKYLPVKQRTMALISHDMKKAEMLRFANNHMALLSKHQRILTTGTTGWALRLLYATPDSEAAYMTRVKAGGYDLKHRLASVFADITSQAGVMVDPMADLEERIDALRKHFETSTKSEELRDLFTSKLNPLPSGPDGGDVLIASEVLSNTCHSVIFFHDPMTAQPHADDIRLLEHTCELPNVFADCVSNIESADQWVKGLRTEIEQSDRHVINPLNLAQELELHHDLKEVILVRTEDNRDSQKLGTALARECALYFHQKLIDCLKSKDEVCVAVGHGWTIDTVREQLRQVMTTVPLAQLPMSQADITQNKKIKWSALTGQIDDPNRYLNASTIARQLNDLYSPRQGQVFCQRIPGEPEAIDAPVYTRDFHKFPDLETHLASLPESDIILVAARSLVPKSPLLKGFGRRTPFPSNIASRISAVISGVALDSEGHEIRPVNGFKHVGLDYAGFQAAADSGSVILICGSEERNEALLAVLRAKLISVLVTTDKTAKWILSRD